MAFDSYEELNTTIKQRKERISTLTQELKEEQKALEQDSEKLMKIKTIIDSLQMMGDINL